MEVKDLGIGERRGKKEEGGTRVGLPDARRRRSSSLSGGCETSPEANARSKSGQALLNRHTILKFYRSKLLVTFYTFFWKISLAIVDPKS